MASLAFGGTQLVQAKVGILSAAVGASMLTWLVVRATALMPAPLRLRALVSTAGSLLELAVPVDPKRDHARPGCGTCHPRGVRRLRVPCCGQAEPAIRALLSRRGDLRYVWRHLPLTDVHPHPQLAAEAAEAAARQGRFWQMQEVLLDHQDALAGENLLGYATQTGRDVERFTRDLEGRAGEAKVAEDADSADLGGVSGTPTFFLNGRRHHGAYDLGALSEALSVARAQALIGTGRKPRPPSDG